MPVKILVVDDDAEILVLIKEALEQRQFSCITAFDAETAIALVSREPFDIVLTDVVMPGMNGLDLIRNLKKTNPKLRVIAMTGFYNEFSFEDALQAGATDFIKKPFPVEELLARLRIVQIQDELRSLAITDELTGLYNRRGFLTLAEHLLKLSVREKSGLYLLYADVNDLKVINDTHGHEAGDAALVAFSELLKTSYRQSDIIARIGGDEFVVFPVGDHRQCIEVIILRLDEIVAGLNKTDKLRSPLSISYGISFFDPEQPCTLAELMMRADQEMYKNKMARKYAENKP